VLSYVDEVVGAPDSRPLRKDRYGVADVFIGLEPGVGAFWDAPV
jgi:hypothetical protein